MNPHIHRVCLVILALSGLIVGPWAYFAPLHWYNTFPGMGMQWLPVLGPFNEHLVKDVGGMYLGLAALSFWTLFHLTNRTLVLITAVSWTIFNTLHLTYHATMLHMYDTFNAVMNVIALTTVLVCSAALAIPTTTATRTDAGTTHADSRL